MQEVFRVTIVTLFLTARAFGDDCSLSPESGFCSGVADETVRKEEIRYYYSAANYKCTEFPYSGCGGNANNFKSVEECKRKCHKALTDLPVLANILSAQAQQKCYYGNRTYAISESIPQAQNDSACSMGCFCSGFRPGHPGPITCAEVDCPPYPDSDGERDCVPVDKNGECCSEYYCPSSAAPETPKPFTCTYKGKEYVEGQIFDRDDYPCIVCRCNKNFTGVLTTEGGVCKEVNCGLLIHNQQKLVNRCTPKFYTTSGGRQSCCPIEWNCTPSPTTKKH